MIQRLVQLSADNSVLVNILFWVICIAGLFAWNLLPKEQFPKVQVDRVAAVIIYPGASAEDVENAVIRPIEKAISTIDGVKHYYSDATEGRALLNVELTRGTDAVSARGDIERAINEVSSLPETVLPPRVLVINVTVPIIRIAVMGDLQSVDYTEALALELKDFPGVSEVQTRGMSKRVIRVDTDSEKLASLGLSHQHIQTQLLLANGSAPAGNIHIGQQTALIRTPKNLTSLSDIQNIHIPTRATGPPLFLKDIARVYEDWEAPQYRYRLNGQPAVILTLIRTDDADAFKTVSAVHEWEKTLVAPKGVVVKSFDNSAIIVQDRLRILAANAAIGIVLVGICLIVFIGLRSTLLVIWGMPVAYLGAILMMYITGNSVNVVSTFALLLVTGIIVDDAVIIVENVQRHIELGKTKVQAAIDGTKQVFGAVFASTLTTCLAFAPLLLLEGTVGRVMSIVPTVVIFSLLMSLVEAFFILPGHLSHFAKERSPETDEAQTKEAYLTLLLKRTFKPILLKIIGPRARYTTALIVAVIILASLSLTKVMKTTLTTEGHPYFVLVNIDLPEGSDATQTDAVLQEIETRISSDCEQLCSWIYSTVGRQIDPSDFTTEGPRYGQFKIGFHNTQPTFDAVPEFLDSLRVQLAQHPEVKSFGIETLKGGPPAGRDLDVKVRSRHTEQLLPASEQLKSHLESRPAISDVRIEDGIGGWEYTIEIDPQRATTLGVTNGQIAQLSRRAIEGESAIELTLNERNTKVIVREANLTEYASAAELGNLSLGFTPQGVPIQLRDVANIERHLSTERIQRVDGQRAIRLSALVDSKLSSSENEQILINEAFETIKKTTPNVDLFYGGQLADSKESFAALPAIFSMAILMIFGVLAIQFKSYLQPIIILSAIPLGAAGVVLGLFSVGMDLSLIAMIGAIGLIGIVVNDSLVLIDFINQLRLKGEGLQEAVVNGTLLRLRPIFITSITTVLGLAPLGLGIAGEEPLLAPMAISISFGLAFATILALFIVPTSYLIIEDLRSFLQKCFTRQKA